MQQQPKFWNGPAPTHCEMSGAPITGVFYDARLQGGGWALMCPACFKIQGCYTGQGHGQKYEKQEEGRWLKTEG